MRQEPVTFSSGPLTLEGVWHWPQGEGPWPAVVVCHPHPLFGGSMDSNVVIAVCQGLARSSMAAFRFNFRGTGESQGNFSDGIGEQDDLKAALALVAASPHTKGRPLGLVGYSFGATVAVPVAPAAAEVQALALVSPPLFPPGLTPLQSYARPKLFLSGSQDSFISANELQRSAEELSPPRECHIIAGADHFWWGYESEIEKRVAEFFAAALTAPSP